jgi:hypothetical protein
MHSIQLGSGSSGARYIISNCSFTWFSSFVAHGGRASGQTRLSLKLGFRRIAKVLLKDYLNRRGDRASVGGCLFCELVGQQWINATK